MQQGHTLFVLQSELIDKKVEISVTNHLIEFRKDIANLREDMMNFRQEMHEMRFELGTRLTAVETALGMRLEKQAEISRQQTEIRNRFLDYSFKAGWIVIFALINGLFIFLSNHLQ